MAASTPPTLPIAGTSAAALDYGKALGTDMVDIFVGPSKVHYHVHKSMLCGQVDYFSKMFNNGFIETVEQAASLPKVDPTYFSLFLEWVYRGSFRHIDLKTSTPTSGPIVDLITLYGFAESICLSALQDCIATSIISTLKDYGGVTLSVQGVVHIYESASSESGLRVFAAESLRYILLWKGDSQDDCWSSERVTEAMKNDELARDLLVLMRSGVKDLYDNPVESANCRFHVHGESEVCNFKFSSDLDDY